MRYPLVLVLLLCGSAAARADGSTAASDEAPSRTDEGQRFVVALKGITGETFDVRGDVSPGQRRCFTTVTSEHGNLLADVQLHAAAGEKWRLDVKLVEYPWNGPAISRTFSELLAPGESKITGPGWNGLVELRLDQK